MRFSLPSLLVVSLFAVVPATTSAQTVDGHWEGAITLPGGEMPFHVDLSKNARGELIATYSRPDSDLNGLPLTGVKLDGRAISFVLTGNTMFQGVIYADGTTISGDVTAPIGSAPFSMTRTGDAKIVQAPRNAAVSRELEGTWSGTLTVQGETLRLILRIANQADGTASGTIISVDRGGLELTLGMAQKALLLTLNSPAVGGDFFTGSLNAAGELAGTFTQGPLSEPLTFRRSQ